LEIFAHILVQEERITHRLTTFASLGKLKQYKILFYLFSDNLNLNEYYQYGACVTSCDPNFTPNLSSICVRCVYQGASCQLNCNPGYTPNPASVSLNPPCILCNSASLVNQGGKCQTSCDLSYKPDPSGICKVCFFFNLYDQSGLCVPNRCNNGYEPDATLVCKSCLQL
jgi:hypothetical protein